MIGLNALMILIASDQVKLTNEALVARVESLRQVCVRGFNPSKETSTAKILSVRNPLERVFALPVEKRPAWAADFANTEFIDQVTLSTDDCTYLSSIDRITGYIVSYSSDQNSTEAEDQTVKPVPSAEQLTRLIQSICDTAGLGSGIVLTRIEAAPGYTRVLAAPRITKNVIYDTPLQFLFHVLPDTGEVTYALMRWIPVLPSSLDAKLSADQARTIAVNDLIEKGWSGDLIEFMPMQLVVESPKVIEGPFESRTKATAAYRTDIVGRLSYHVIYHSAAPSFDDAEKPLDQPRVIHYYIDPNNGRILNLATFASGGGSPTTTIATAKAWRLQPGSVLAIAGGNSKSIQIGRLIPRQETLGQFSDTYLVVGNRTVRAGFDAARGLLRVVESKGPVVYQLDASAAKSLRSILK